jgi:hypothetical protein
MLRCLSCPKFKKIERKKSRTEQGRRAVHLDNSPLLETIKSTFPEYNENIIVHRATSVYIISSQAFPEKRRLEISKQLTNATSERTLRRTKPLKSSYILKIIPKESCISEKALFSTQGKIPEA